MIYVEHNGEIVEVTGVFIGNTPITSMYRGQDNLFSDAAQVCFVNGQWVDLYPWDDNSYWRDEP